MEAVLNYSDLDTVNGIYSYADYLSWRFEQAVELIKGKILPKPMYKLWPPKTNVGLTQYLLYS